MEAVQKMLKPGGLLLLHFITKHKEEVGGGFTLRYIFPGGYIPSVRETVSLFAEEGLHLLDVENLRYHYALTLDHWAKNFNQNLGKVRELFQAEKFKERWQGDADVERFIKMWHLYLRGSAAGFRAGTIELHQFLVSKGVNNHLPLTREAWYK
jgi:cyclopropane-fatty-acyl-phospholipid synthase